MFQNHTLEGNFLRTNPVPNLVERDFTRSATVSRRDGRGPYQLTTEHELNGREGEPDYLLVSRIYGVPVVRWVLHFRVFTHRLRETFCRSR